MRLSASELPLIYQVTGAPGSGVSTVGRLLAAQLGCEFLDLDDVHWRPSEPPYIEERSASEKIAIVSSVLHSPDQWAVVVCGSLIGWADEFAKALSGCLYLRCPAGIRIDRILRREKERFSSAIENGGAMHERHMAFMQWASSYDTRRFVVDPRCQEGDLLWLAKLSCPTFLLSSNELSAMECAELMLAYGKCISTNA
jgi:adenylate kinase family enzyme